MAHQAVTFFIPDAEQVASLIKADPDRDFQLFGTGVQVWIGQTYLRLKQMGLPVILSHKVPTSGIAVVHADHVSDVLRGRSLLSDLTLVVVRADRPHRANADFEIVQNAHSAGNNKTFHIQHWPQPGLIARDPARDCKVENVAFKGAVGEMAQGLTTPEWAESLREQGMEWRTDAVTFTGNNTAYQVNWHDYRDVDVVVAMRKDTSRLYANKPASKLINAWLAGVPAILGPEQAFRELKRDELDYIEVKSEAEAREAILRLKNDPVLYQAMVERAHQRAQEVTTRQCAANWAKLLFETIPERKGSTLTTLMKLFASSMRSHLSYMLTAGQQRARG
jgi:hypothetical protein